MQDYVSTLPWNDPLDPWPVYSQLLVTSVGESSTETAVYSLSVFQPTSPGLFSIFTSPPEQFIMYMIYVKNGSNSLSNSISYCLSANTVGYGVLQNVWIWNNNTAGFGAFKVTDRNNLYKPVSGESEEWTTMAGDISGSTIAPVLSSVLGFEKRRIAGGIG
jgi:hypothetical protein